MKSVKREGEGDIAFFLRNVGMGAAAACTAEVLTLPMDTAKVRMQIQKILPGEVPKYSGLMGTCKTITAEEGPMALWNGLTPGLQRQVVYAGLRIGLYVPVRNLITGELPEGVNPTVLQKILAGVLTGSFGITVANPTDVVKIRLQAQGRLPLNERPYNGTFDCYRKTLAQSGVKGLWVGYGANVMRNSIINAAELASYDQFRQIALQNLGLSDSAPTHLICAFSAGFVATVVGSPVDVLKTRLMNAAPGQPKSLGGTLVYIVKNEGPLAFYKGFVANYMRLGCWNAAMFVTLEQIKKFMA